MDEAQFRKIIECGREREARAAREHYIIQQDLQRDRLRADAKWKFEHELRVDNYRRQAFYNSAFDRRRWGGYEQARRDLECLERSGHAYNFQAN